MSDTTPIQTLDEAAIFFLQNPPIVIKLYPTFKEQYAACFKEGAEWQAKQQVVNIDEVDLRKKAGEAWEVENKYHPNGINPTAFEFGYKVGYKAALKNK